MQPSETPAPSATEQTLLELITDGFLSLDKDWRITYVNAETERLTGGRRAEMVGRTLWQLFPEAVGTKVHDELLLAMAERAAVDFENHYAPWKRWFHIKAHPDGAGGLFVFFEDIGARKAAEEALRESEQRFPCHCSDHT